MVSMEKCILFETTKSCGQYKPYKIEDSMITFLALKESINIERRYPDLSEAFLIMSRINLPVQDDSLICPFHRAKFGKEWRSSKLCIHPSHTGKKHQLLRNLTHKEFMALGESFPDAFIPFGALICTTHRKQLSENDRGREGCSEEEDGDLQAETACADGADPEYTPDSFQITPGSSQTLNSISEIVSVTPVKYQVSKPVNELKTSTLRYLKRKILEITEEATRTAIQSIAPGQSEELYDILFRNPDDDVPADLVTLYKQFKEATRYNEKMALLSLISFQNHSKAEIMEIFRCSRHLVDKAEHASTLANKTENKRSRLDVDKAKHFIDFLFSSGAIQEMAHGTSLMRFDEVDNQRVPKAILTVMKSHVICLYKQLCDNTSFNPLSDSTLFRILSEMKLTQRKALAGLDNVSAAGISAINAATILVQSRLTDITVQEKNSLLQRIKRLTRYMKLEYKMNCSKPCHLVSSHCTCWGISDPLKKQLSVDCKSSHTKSCQECENVLDVFTILKEYGDRETDAEHRADIFYDISVIEEDVMFYMKHILRDCQQDKSKQSILKDLSDEDIYWIKDWSQKILPKKFREPQRDYFGKKGISQHVDVIYHKENGTLHKLAYFTIIQRCNQDLAQTMSVASHVAAQIREDFPNVKNVYVKSDNAGCYAGNGHVEGEHHILKLHDLNLKRHDYNEPQRGKDQCDRESATAQHQRSAYINAGHDIQTASDVKNSLCYMGGVKNAKFSVVSINDTINHINAQIIDNISNYHSVELKDKIMKFWNFFDIGEGRDVAMKDVDFSSGLEVLSKFESSFVNPTNSTPKKKPRLDRKRGDAIKVCHVQSCSKTFMSHDELEQHLLKGDHIYQLTGMDSVKQQYLEHVLSNATPTTSLSGVDTIPSSDFSDYFIKGWALPKRKHVRFSPKQLGYIFDIFINGESTGQKAVPEDVVTNMRTLRVDGKKQFVPNEYLRVSQVKSLFSRFAKQKRQGNLKQPQQSAELQQDLIEEESNETEAEAVLLEEQRDMIIEDLFKVVPSCGEWVLVKYDGVVFVGIILQASNDEYQVKTMLKAGINSFKWPRCDDVCWYKDITDIIDPPSPINKRGMYKLSDDDLETFEYSERST